MRYLPKNEVICDYCGTHIFRWQHQLKKQKHFYCGRLCEKGYKKGKLSPWLAVYAGKNGGWNKGKKMKVEQVEKMREQKIEYYKLHPEAKIQISNFLTGRKQSDETIEKRVMHLRGKKRPNWVKDKLSKSARRGEFSHFWRGGVSPVRKRLREIPLYREWRESVYKRDNFTCQLCGVRGGKLEADHIIPFSSLIELVRVNNPKDLFTACKLEPRLWDIDNGRTLCKKCHHETPTYAKNTAYQPKA